MEEKKYLKWYNKIGYGSGDIAGNVVYAFLTSFMMVYLTDSVGLAAGVVGTLIAVSKLIDGFTDIFFGSMIDKTHSKMGKAKPWMLYGYIGCAITLVCCFAVPVSWGTTAKYAWFFISYTLLQFAPHGGHWCVCQRPPGGAQRPPSLRYFDRLNNNNVMLRCPLHNSVG